MEMLFGTSKSDGKLEDSLGCGSILLVRYHVLHDDCRWVGVQDYLFIVQDMIIEDNQVFIQIEDAKVHVCTGNIQIE